MRNVRQAYRFLGGFNESLKDVVQLVMDEFAGLSYYHWTPRPFGILSRSMNPMSKSGWDALPYFNFSLLYLPDEAIARRFARQGDWMFEICVELDSDFAAHDGSASSAPLRFDAVEDAESMISLVAWRCDVAVGDGPNWYNTWINALEYGEVGTLNEAVISTGDKFTSYYVQENFEKLGSEKPIREFSKIARKEFLSELDVEPNSRFD